MPYDLQAGTYPFQSLHRVPDVSLSTPHSNLRPPRCVLKLTAAACSGLEPFVSDGASKLELHSPRCSYSTCSSVSARVPSLLCLRCTGKICNRAKEEPFPHRYVISLLTLTNIMVIPDGMQEPCLTYSSTWYDVCLEQSVQPSSSSCTARSAQGGP